MAECTQHDQLMAYHDGELPPERRAAFERHLAECDSCARELRRLRALSGLVREFEVPPMPQGMMERLREALGPARERSIIRLCRTVSLAAAALLAVCIGLLMSDGLDGANGAGGPAGWELAAVTLDADLAEEGAHEAAALWIVGDLSRENGR
jgi:anti-sigma factor RsiW